MYSDPTPEWRKQRELPMSNYATGGFSNSWQPQVRDCCGYANLYSDFQKNKDLNEAIQFFTTWLNSIRDKQAKAPIEDTAEFESMLFTEEGESD